MFIITAKRKYFRGCLILWSVVALVLVGVTILYGSITLPKRQYYSEKSDTCITYYTITSNSEQCGLVNSHDYQGVCFNGEKKNGDATSGTVKIWVVPQQQLHLHFKHTDPIIHNHVYVSQRKPVFINDNYSYTYTWLNSTIFGFCCVSNNGTSETNTSMYIFDNETDVFDFVNGKGAKNAVINETMIMEPDGMMNCFTKWGSDAPLRVNESAYYYIAVDLPAHSTYNSNVTIIQAFVDTSEYGTPRYVTTSNSTNYDISSEYVNYVGICEGPYTEKYDILQPLPAPDAESLHIQTCYVPKPTLLPQTTPIAIVSTLSAIAILLCIATCIILYCCLRRERSVCSCHNYDPLD